MVSFGNFGWCTTWARTKAGGDAHTSCEVCAARRISLKFSLQVEEDETFDYAGRNKGGFWEDNSIKTRNRGINSIKLRTSNAISVSLHFRWIYCLPVSHFPQEISPVSIFFRTCHSSSPGWSTGCQDANAILSDDISFSTRWRFRIELQKWNYSECCLGYVLVKLKRRLHNSIQNSSISGVQSRCVTRYTSCVINNNEY